MTAYTVQKLLFHVNTRPEIAARFEADRAALFDEYRIAEDERRLLETGDFGALWEAGVHELLLMPYAMRCGLAWQDYLHAMAHPGPTLSRGDIA